ncbi:MAG: ComF family protein, partial [candidate division KSB1 bacterium]|nr:ComF family protein [candidate division KSB1 bacterium]
MAEKLKPLNFSPDETLLIPVPLHKTRARERGYNQSALLCRAIARQTGLPYDEHILKRVRYTRSQTKLSASERLKNVNQAFRIVNKEPIQNKNVILIDDVITTGATMNECARELITNGARTVALCAIAHA